VSAIIPRLGGGPSSIGMEEAQVAAVVQIFNNVDACLTRQAQAWDPIDQQLSQALGARYRRTVLERPPKGCIYSGVRGGVLDMPWDRFPALYVMADRATARQEAGSEATSINAIIECVELDPTLGGAVLPLPDASAGQTDPFALQGQDPRDKTKKRIFSAIRIDWTLDTYSVRLDAQTPVPGVLPTGLGGQW
jgi:hypothetical protein